MSQKPNMMEKEHKENLNLLFYDFNHNAMHIEEDP